MRLVAWLRNVRWKRLALELAVAGALVVAIGLWQARNLLPTGQPAPQLVLSDRDGAPFDLAALRGEKVVVAFWAPWCTVCKLEMPTLNALAASGVRVVGVALSYGDRAEVDAFAREHEVTFPVLLGADSTGADWAVTAYPTLYVVNEAGELRHAVVGYTTRLGLWLRLLLA